MAVGRAEGVGEADVAHGDLDAGLLVQFADDRAAPVLTVVDEPAGQGDGAAGGGDGSGDDDQADALRRAGAVRSGAIRPGDVLSGAVRDGQQRDGHRQGLR